MVWAGKQQLEEETILSDDPKLHALIGSLTDAKATVFDGTVPVSLNALMKAVAGGGAAAGLTDTQLRATPVPTSEAKSSTATLNTINSSATSVTIVPANAARKGGAITNESPSILYLLLGTGPAIATAYTVKMLTDDYYELPYGYTGIVVGIWASASGWARVTELS